MLWSAPQPLVSTYRVEVSGWDSAQSFFVEIANLEWDETSSKNITLGRSLCPGTMVFCAPITSHFDGALLSRGLSSRTYRDHRGGTPTVPPQTGSASFWSG